MDKKQLLHTISSNVGENWYESGIDKNGKAYAETDSEIAMKSLLETLFNLGFNEFYELDECRQLNGIKADYIFCDKCNNGLWSVVVMEL